MAFDIADKPYSDAAIIRSVYDLASNSLQVTSTGGGSGSVPVQQELLMDDNNNAIFIRTYIYDAAGAFDSVEDIDLDGAPYVLIGNAVSVAETQLGELQTIASRTLVGPVERAYHDYSGGNVTTAAYTQLIASTTSDVKQLEIFDSSGQLLILALGAAASEVDTLYILPGGNGQVTCYIPVGSRISIKAVSANATTGYIAINLIN